MNSKYKSIVRKAALAAGAIGVPGAFSFGVDAVAICATWVTMMIAIADRAGRTMDRTTAAKAASGVIAGVSLYYGGSKVATTLLNFIPGAGTVAAVLTNSSFNAFYTYKLGNALSEVFDRPHLDVNDATVLVKILLSIMLPTLFRHASGDLPDDVTHAIHSTA